MVNEETTDQTDDFGVSIDPATWPDPKETFPGRILVSEKRWASDEYRQETSFRPQITDPLPQWDVRVERLDARLVLPDGQQAPAIRYGGVDLKKWSRNDQCLVPISSRYQKEWYIVSEWKRVFGKTEPPSILVGRMAMFDFFRSKSFGGSIPASNVLVPVSVLPPDYMYDGEVQLITVREREGAEGGEAASVPAAASSNADEATIVEELFTGNGGKGFLAGQNVNNPAAIITALPNELRAPSILSGIADQSLFTQLAEQGRIEVEPDGTISVAA